MTPVECARRAAAAILDVPAAELIAHDLTGTLPWVRQHTVVVAGDGATRLTIAVGVSGESLAFEDATDVAPLNRFFDVENILLPDGLPPEHLADVVRLLLAGPGGFVATPKFVEEERHDLSAWLRPPEKEGERLFAQHSAPPVLDNDRGRWTLSFNFFNRKGAVERWTVEGERNVVARASFELALPEWTFRFPYV